MSAQVHAVTWASTPVPKGVEVVEHGQLAAAVSTPKPEARRRDLLRHADVVQQIFTRSAVVPLQFGAVLGDVVSELLEPRHDEFVSLLRELEGLAEFTVRATYRQEDALRALLEEQPRLARMRGTASPLELGEAVAHALAARRDADAAAIVRALERRAKTAALDPRRTDLDVVRAAFLVGRKDLGAFDAAVESVGREHGATTSFKVTGPLPPHHFVRLDGGQA